MIQETDVVYWQPSFCRALPTRFCDRSESRAVAIHPRPVGKLEGVSRGQVYAITQTGDGYLWIGAEKGLVRFDGINFRLFHHANTPLLPVGPVLGLVADAEGGLWIRWGPAYFVTATASLRMFLLPRTRRASLHRYGPRKEW